MKGHSGCDVQVRRNGNILTIQKTSFDKSYLDRLIQQGEKQDKAAQIEYQHIRVPKILHTIKEENRAILEMEYVYSKNFADYFDHAGFEQIDYFVHALILFIEKEIQMSEMQHVPSVVVKEKVADVKKKVLSRFPEDLEIRELLFNSEIIISEMEDIELPIGKCHGDLTFSNILFNGNNYYLIDFLDSFIETPLLDIVKIRQDSAYYWSKIMYSHPIDEPRLKTICNHIDTIVNRFFQDKYDWYGMYYKPFQLLNFLRILQYAKEENVVSYLKNVIKHLLHEQ